jgi:energy-coupling factor transporter ATP-binding protein EcfA2
VLLTDHSVRETLAIADRVVLMFDGRVRFDGSPPTSPRTPTCAARTWGTSSSCDRRARGGGGMTYVAGLVALLVTLAGVIAYAGDRLGTWVGRRRLTLFGARPGAPARSSASPPAS